MSITQLYIEGNIGKLITIRRLQKTSGIQSRIVEAMRSWELKDKFDICSSYI